MKNFNNFIKKYISVQLDFYLDIIPILWIIVVKAFRGENVINNMDKTTLLTFYLKTFLNNVDQLIRLELRIFGLVEYIDISSIDSYLSRSIFIVK